MSELWSAVLSLCIATSVLVLSTEVSIGTFNVKHRSDQNSLHFLTQQIDNEFKATSFPQYLALQEVVFDPDNQSTASFLASHLKYYSFGRSRTSDREGVAILSKRAFVFTDSLQHEAMPSCLINCTSRVTVMAEVQEPSIGLIRIISTHLTNRREEAEVRLAQVKEVQAWLSIRERQSPAAMTFWAGDFNADWNTPELKQIYQNTEIQFMNFNSTRPTWSIASGVTRRLDQIFVRSNSPSLQLRSETIHFSSAFGICHFSDHGLLRQVYRVSQN